MTANNKQIGGSHYEAEYQHWDLVADCHVCYFRAVATKYLTRWKKKNGLQDIQKGLHFLDKYIELVDQGRADPYDEAVKPYQYNLIEKWGRANGLSMDSSTGDYSLSFGILVADDIEWLGNVRRMYTEFMTLVENSNVAKDAGQPTSSYTNQG